MQYLNLAIGYMADVEAQSESKLEAFFRKFTPHHAGLIYKKGEIILRAGDPPPGVLYLAKGLVRQYVVSARGEQLVLHMFRPGSFFPMTWVLNNTPNAYDFAAATAVEVWRAPKDAVVEFIEKNPDILLAFSRRLLSGLNGLLTRVASLVFDQAYLKIVLLLLYLARAVGESKGREVILPVTFTHKDIASWVGTTRETASLQMEELKHRGLINYQGRKLVISSLKRLEQEAHLSS